MSNEQNIDGKPIVIKKPITYPIFCKLCDMKIEDETHMHFHMIYAHDVTRTKILDLIEEFMKNG